MRSLITSDTGEGRSGARAVRTLAAWIAKEGAAALVGPLDRPRVTTSAERRRVGERLRWVRTCAGFSRRELAMLLALGDERSVEQRLYRYESGRAAVPIEVLQRAADVLSLSIELFVAVDAADALAHTRLRQHQRGKFAPK